MNLLLYWGNAIWGIMAIKWIIVGVFGLDTIRAIALGFADPASFIDAGIDIILVIIFLILGFPIKGLIITLLILHIIGTIIWWLAASGGEAGGVPFFFNLLHVIGDIIGMVLFFKNVL